MLKQKSFEDVRMKRNEKGVTLLALIITIIILLILAGVTIVAVTGQNGLMNRAKQAKERTEVAQYEEELKMCVSEIQMDAEINDNEFGIGAIRDSLQAKVNELQDTEEIEIEQSEEETTIKGTYKGYEFEIDENYIVKIGDKAKGISITTSIEPKGWTTESVKATITIKSNEGIRKIVPEGEDEINLDGAKKYVITKDNITENKIFTYEVTDMQGTMQTKTAAITTIDKTEPDDFTITASNTEEGLKIDGTTTDAISGIDKYEYYVKKSDGDYVKYETNLIKDLESGTYSIYVKAYDKAGNVKQSSNTVENLKVEKIYSNITAQMVAEKPSKYYGLKVINYNATVAENINWKIFYSDNEHIFLIAENYVNLEKIDSIPGMEKSAKHAYWKNPVSQIDQITEDVKLRFKATGYKLQSAKDNSNCASTLLNTSNWEKYKDSNGMAEYAIGSPTIEMWIASWNERYPNDKLYWKASTNGYCIGTSENPDTKYILSNEMYNKEGYNNSKLYYYDKNNSTGAVGYWLASPSASANYKLFRIDYDSTISDCPRDNSNTGVRPVVSLNSGITVNATDP